MVFVSNRCSDDEGSDEEEEEEEEEEDEYDDDEEYQEAEEEQQQEESESPSFFFGTNSTQQKNAFQFGPPTPTSSKAETVSGLSNMMAKFDFNVNSPFNFGLQPPTEVISIISDVCFLNDFISIRLKIINGQH
jgi:type I restriction-modification system DNA methylase subunit